jgi:geranylgeranyl pyrophosphate synthase
LPERKTAIPDYILHLFEATYDFIYIQVLKRTNWSDAVVAVEAWQESFADGYGVYSGLLPLLACVATGGEAQKAIPLAAAWMLYDLASEIFDDVQDRDGKDRPWNQWHPSRAIGVGLGMIASADICLARLQTSHDVLSEILESWARTLTLAARDQWSSSEIPTLEQYFNQTVTKSGLIYATVAWAGARLSSNENPVLEAMKSYGMGLGMVTQIWDDCLDLSPQKIKSDLVLGTYTLPVIYTLSLKEDPNYPELLAKLNSSSELTSVDIETICGILGNMGAISYCVALMKVYEQKALNALTVIDDGQYVAYLENYVSAFLLSPNDQYPI